MNLIDKASLASLIRSVLAMLIAGGGVKLAEDQQEAAVAVAVGIVWLVFSLSWSRKDDVTLARTDAKTAGVQ